MKPTRRPSVSLVTERGMYLCTYLYVIAPHVSGVGGLGCESVGKADLPSDNFDSKQFWESVDLPLTSHLSPIYGLVTFAFS